MTIDIRTLALAAALADILQIAALYLQFRLNRSYRGTGWWLLWGGCTASGFLLMLARDYVPSWLVPASILAANTLLLAGLLCIYTGIRHFTGTRYGAAPTMIIGAAFLLVTFWVIFIDPHEEIRVLALYLASSALLVLAAAALYKSSTPSYRASAGFLAAVLFLEGAYFLARSIGAMTAAPIDNVFSATPWQEATFLVTASCGLLTTFGLIIMVGQRSGAEMREAREEFELIFNLGPDAAVITRREDDHIININDGFTELTGFSRKDCTGQSILALGLWQKPSDYHNLLAQLTEGTSCGYYVAPLTRKDGQSIDCVLSARAVNIAGAPHVISTMRDNTERRRQAEERQRIERLDALGRMAGGMAGEFEEILTEALGIITLAGKESRHDTPIRGRLEQAEKAMLEARENLGRLRVFARDEEEARCPVSMADLLRDTVGYALRGSNMQCRLVLPDSMWAAYADRGQVSRVINCLTSNARATMPEGGTIEITAANLAAVPGNLPLEGGRYVRVTFTILGQELTREQVERLFDPFPTGQDGGSLELAACFAIARRHGGHLVAEAVPGGGTTYTLLLPACTAEPGNNTSGIL
jgi:PAS domain S-box-containing protein